MKFNGDQKKMFAGKAMDLANLSLAALTFASFFTDKFSLKVSFLGILLFIVLFLFSYFLTKGD